MRVLWISNIEITEELKSSGSWIFAMAHAFLSVSEITLGNIVPLKTKEVVRSDFKSIQQWKIPGIKNSYKTGLTEKDKKNILDIVSVFQPDIIHVWGLENGFALITPFIKCPVIVEIQGINSEISKYYYGGLSLLERLKVVGFKELVTINPLSRQKHRFAIMAKRESRIFDINKYFTTPTEWMQANVEARKSKGMFFSNGFILRDEFYEAEEWMPNENYVILTSASDVAPFKGLHVLFDTLSLLKEKFPKIQLRIIGPFVKRGVRTRAYIYYLEKKLKKLGLENNVLWLGSLNAEEICEQIQTSSVFVNPSFIESAGMTILEAMAIGIPIVSSYTGGIPSFTSGSMLFFTPGDYKMCAFQISKALIDKDIKMSSVIRSRSYINKYHNKKLIARNQIDIYKSIINENIIS